MYKRPISSFFQPVKKQATGKKSRANATSGIGDAATHDSARADSSLSSGKNQYTVFCDLDGVLVDFDAGVRRLLGKSPDQVPSKRLWPAIHGAPHFYRDLPWMEDGEELWEALRRTPFPLNILTGVSARGGIVQDKYLWCQRELCVETALVDMTGLAGNKRHEPAQSNVRRKHGVVNVITCWSKNKHCESKRGHVLIDDRDKLREAWEKAGGIFILHTSTRSTLDKLRQCGVLPIETVEEQRKTEKPRTSLIKSAASEAKDFG